MAKELSTREQRSEELEAAALKISPEHLLEMLKVVKVDGPSKDAKP